MSGNVDTVHQPIRIKYCSPFLFDSQLVTNCAHTSPKDMTGKSTGGLRHEQKMSDLLL